VGCRAFLDACVRAASPRRSDCHHRRSRNRLAGPNTGFDTTGFQLTGLDSIFTGANFGNAIGVPPQGGQVNLGRAVFLTDDFPFHHPVSEVVNGTHYQAFLSGSLAFITAPLVIPPPSDQSSFNFGTPFTMTGHITGTETDPTFPGAPVLFSVDVTGSGRAGVFGTVAGPAGTSDCFYVPQFLDYSFESSPAPTPEPSTLLLLGSALRRCVLASCAVWVRRCCSLRELIQRDRLRLGFCVSQMCPTRRPWFDHLDRWKLRLRQAARRDRAPLPMISAKLFAHTNSFSASRYRYGGFRVASRRMR